MLPNSHPSPIIGSVESGPIPPGLDSFSGAATSTPADASATVATSTAALALAEAFAGFVSTSSRLEHSYRELQGEVSGLRVELEERNHALKGSLAENQRVRAALQQIVDSMPCGVLVVTRDGELTTVNPEASRLLALPASEPLPSSLADLEEKRGLDGCLTRLTNGGSDSEQELCLQTGAAERWLHILVRQLAGSATERTQELTIVILRDVTAHKRAERDREAAHNATVLAQITSMLAHEIRNPLGSMELFAELVEKDAVGRAEWIANLRAGIRSLSVTVNNVLGLHDAGSLERKPLRLADVIASTVRFARPLADQASVSLRWLSGGREEWIDGNEGALQQVLLNLIRNAVRHTPAGGSITLSLESTRAGSVVLRCTDNGSGIPPEAMDRLFQPGFSGRGDSPGLGLAVCERIMAQHGGRISAANVKGAGACFALTFPGCRDASGFRDVFPFQEELVAA